MSHPRSHLIEVEDRRQSFGLPEMDLAGSDHIVVDDAVRIDHLIYRLPLFGIRFDAELDRLHRLNHDCGVYKRDRGVSEFSEFCIQC